MSSRGGRARARSLWQNRAFVRLWVAHTTSQLGSQVSEIVFPLVALLQFNASAASVGLLVAAEYAPFVLFALVVGRFVDRGNPRTFMIVADIGRAVLVAAIVVGVATGVLGFVAFVMIAFAIGALTLLFSVSQVAIVPSVVKHEELTSANSALESSRAAATIAGPSLGGALTSLVTASGALVADLVSYLASAASLVGIPRERTADVAETEGVAWSRTGLREVYGHPALRPIAMFMAVNNGALGAYMPVVVTFQVRDLDLSPVTIGLIAAAGNLGFLVGAFSCRRLAALVGIGPCMCAGAFASAAGMLLVATAPDAVKLEALVVGGALTGGGAALFTIQSVALRQAISPPRLLGRIDGAMRFASWGTIPVGALAGGFLAAPLGFELTLGICGGLALLAAARLWLTPVRPIRDLTGLSHFR